MPEMPQISQSTVSAFESLSDDEKRTALGKMSTQAKEALLGQIKIKQNAGRATNPSRDLVSAPTVDQSGTRDYVNKLLGEAEIGLLEPFSARDASGSWQIPPAVTAVATTINKAGTVMDATKSPSQQVGALRGLVSDFYHSTVDPITEWIGALSKGDYEAAANASGKFPLQVAPGVAGAVDTVRTVTPSVGQLRETARSVASSKVAPSAVRTAVEKFGKEAEAGRTAQAAADVRSAAATEANRAQTAEQIAVNRETATANSRAEGIQRSLQEGSTQLGNRVKNLDGLLREEAKTNYDAVREAVKDDPGVPLTDLAEAARHAEANILKGSQESIKQFRELARKAPEDEGVTTGGVTFPPGSKLFEMLQEQGALEPGGTLPFDQLQGYSSEIGRKLAAGNLPGDIYQALKYVKEKIDAAKSTIAERNGAGKLLRTADDFWREYMDLFYDKDSAIAKVREAVGSKNPSEAANEFFRGKANEVAVGKLKRLKSQYSKDASSLADLAQNLKTAQMELETVPTGKVKPVEPPERVSETVEQPKPPTAEELAAAKRGQATSTAENLGRLRPYDIAILAGSPLGMLMPTWAKAAGIAIEGARFGVPMAMKSQAFLDFISKPTAADLAIVEKLPEPALAELKANLRREIAVRTQQGASAVPIAPAIQRLVGSMPKNRQEARDLLHRQDMLAR